MNPGTATHDVDPQRLVELLRAIDHADQPERLTHELRWTPTDFTVALREARTRGMLTGIIAKRATIDLSAITLTPLGRRIARQSRW